MGSGNLNMAKTDNPGLAGRLRWSDGRDDVLVPGDGPGGPLDTLQLTSNIYFSFTFDFRFSFQFNEQKAWIADNFPRDRRYENLILESENVLTADTVRYVCTQKYVMYFKQCSKVLFSLQNWTREYESTSLRIT